MQVDKIINDANVELEILNQKLAGKYDLLDVKPLLMILAVMQVDQDKLKMENTNLVAAFREKSRKHQQTQELYDRLKRKEMTAATQSAAYDSVDEVLGSISSRQDQIQSDLSHPYQFMSRPYGQQNFSHSSNELKGSRQAHGKDRTGSNGGYGSMAPPTTRVIGFENRSFEFGKSCLKYDSSSNSLLGQGLPTPAQHRNQLGGIHQSGSQFHTGNYLNPGHNLAGGLQQTPSQRQPLANVGSSSLNRSGVSGYGMSAGMKVGRQQGQYFYLFLQCRVGRRVRAVC